MLYKPVQAALFSLDPEDAHNIAVTALSYLPYLPPTYDPILRRTVFGIDFPTPICLAAGFDKNAVAVDGLLTLGFGAVEVGSVTMAPQVGNTRPRILRIPEEYAILNSMGCPNDGASRVAKRLAVRKHRGIVGTNIAASRSSITERETLTDYKTTARMVAAYSDYLTINVSSPNTPGLTNLQKPQRLTEIIDVVKTEMEKRTVYRKPVLVKVSPDLSHEELTALAKVRGIDGIIATNTTRRLGAGLSGSPLREKSTRTLRWLSMVVGDKIPLVACGGISNVDDVHNALRDGAVLVQILTAMVYEGPFIARRLSRQLAKKLRGI